MIEPQRRREAFCLFARKFRHEHVRLDERHLYIFWRKIFQILMLLKNAQKYTWAITFLAAYIFVIRFRELPWKFSLLKLDYLALCRARVSSYPSKSTVLIRCEGELTENVPTLLCNSRKKCRRFTSNLVQISLKDLTFPEQPKAKTAREHRPLSQKRQQTAFETSIMDQSQAVKSKVNGLLQEPMANIFKAIGNWKVEKLVAGKKKSSKKYMAP